MLSQDLIAKFYQAYNETARLAGIPVARALTSRRATQMKARLTEAEQNGTNPQEAWDEAMTALLHSSFCRGHNSRSWKADLDFVLQPLSFWRLVEGFYGDTPETPPPEDQGAALLLRQRHPERY